MGTVDGPDDLVGRRVALRHRLGSGLLTDAVGELSAADDGALVVHTRRGAVRVARSDVVAVRAIPPPVPRRASWAAVARLENLCADAWPARVDRAARGLAAAGDRRVHGAGERGARRRRPGGSGSGGAGGRPRVRRRARGDAARARTGRVAVGPGRGARGLGARRRPRGGRGGRGAGGRRGPARRGRTDMTTLTLAAMPQRTRWCWRIGRTPPGGRCRWAVTRRPTSGGCSTRPVTSTPAARPPRGTTGRDPAPPHPRCAPRSGASPTRA